MAFVHSSNLSCPLCGYVLWYLCSCMCRNQNFEILGQESTFRLFTFFYLKSFFSFSYHFAAVVDLLPDLLPVQEFLRKQYQNRKFLPKSSQVVVEGNFAQSFWLKFLSIVMLISGPYWPSPFDRSNLVPLPDVYFDSWTLIPVTWLLCHYFFYCCFSQSQILPGKVQARSLVRVSLERFLHSAKFIRDSNIGSLFPRYNKWICFIIYESFNHLSHKVFFIYNTGIQHCYRALFHNRFHLRGFYKRKEYFFPFTVSKEFFLLMSHYFVDTLVFLFQEKFAP